MTHTYSATPFRNILFVAFLCLGAPAVLAATSGKEILDTAGVEGGLVVHLGCGDGKLTALLRGNDRYLVHGLDTDVKHVEKARAHVDSLGLYGAVTIDTFDGRRLQPLQRRLRLLSRLLDFRSPGGLLLVAEWFLVPFGNLQNRR